MNSITLSGMVVPRGCCVPAEEDTTRVAANDSRRILVRPDISFTTSIYQMIFAASWMTRPAPALVMRPKLVEEPDVGGTVVLGLLKFTRLNALKNSPRICRRTFSLRLM